MDFAQPGIAVVALFGEHDLSGKQRLSDALAKASVRRDVLVDLSACTFLDSSVIGTLFAARADLPSAAGGSSSSSRRRRPSFGASPSSRCSAAC